LQVANLVGINLFTSSLELAKFSTLTRFKNRPLAAWSSGIVSAWVHVSREIESGKGTYI
jgi:hypothetical protein